MKKYIQFAIPMAAVLLVSGVALAGKTGEKYTAPAVSDTEITIDGTFGDAGWAKAPLETIDEAKVPAWRQGGTYVEGDAPTNSADASLSFKVAHSAKFLYFMASVNDESFNSEKDVIEWTEDTLELYFDGQNAGGAAHEKDMHVQMRVTPQASTYPTGGGHFQRMGSTEGAWEIHNFDAGMIGATGKIVGTVSKIGWTIEMAIPWDELEFWVGPHASVMGFDPQLNDNDEGGSVRATQLHWSGDGTDWQVPDQFGVLVLAK